jgi:hypothetical protein
MNWPNKYGDIHMLKFTYFDNSKVWHGDIVGEYVVPIGTLLTQVDAMLKADKSIDVVKNSNISVSWTQLGEHS